MANRKLTQGAITTLCFTMLSCSMNTTVAISNEETAVAAAGAAALGSFITYCITQQPKKEPQKALPEEVLAKSNCLTNRLQRKYQKELNILDHSKGSQAEVQLAKYYSTMSSYEYSSYKPRISDDLRELDKQEKDIYVLPESSDQSTILEKKKEQLARLNKLKEQLARLESADASSNYKRAVRQLEVKKRFEKFNSALPYDVHVTEWKGLVQRAQSLESRSSFPLHNHLGDMRKWLEESHCLSKETKNLGLVDIARSLEPINEHLTTAIAKIAKSKEYAKEQKQVDEFNRIEREAHAKQRENNKLKALERELEKERLSVQKEHARAQNRKLDYRQRELRLREQKVEDLKRKLEEKDKEILELMLASAQDASKIVILELNIATLKREKDALERQLERLRNPR